MLANLFAELGTRDADAAPTGITGIESLLSIAGGLTFGDGLYRVHSEASSRTAHSLVMEGFPGLPYTYTLFGFDWLGRQFGKSDGQAREDGGDVVMFEPGTGQILDIPTDMAGFHETELIKYGDEALAAPFYALWTRSGGARPNFSQCVGYRVPLFLGGVDGVENLELSDLEVYWTVAGQLIRQVADLAPETRITHVETDDA